MALTHYFFVMLSLFSLSLCWGMERSVQDSKDFSGSSSVAMDQLASDLKEDLIRFSEGAKSPLTLEGVLNSRASEIDLLNLDKQTVEGPGKESFLSLFPEVFKGNEGAFLDVIQGLRNGYIKDGGIVGFKSPDRKDLIMFTAAKVFARARYERLSKKGPPSQWKLWSDKAFQQGVGKLVFFYSCGIGTEQNPKISDFLEKEAMPPQEEDSDSDAQS